MAVRGIRGATVALENSSESIVEATTELLREMTRQNGVQIDDIASVLFSVTPDLDAEYPALAARESLGWADVPLFGSSESQPPGSIPRCIRVLILWNTDAPRSRIQFVYLRNTDILRQSREGK